MLLIFHYYLLFSSSQLSLLKTEKNKVKTTKCTVVSMELVHYALLSTKGKIIVIQMFTGKSQDCIARASFEPSVLSLL